MDSWTLTLNPGEVLFGQQAANTALESRWAFVLNTSVALGLGMLIGLERRWRQHPAGLRTNTLVSLGAALFVSLSLLLQDHNSPTRMASYVVSGLGFLGGGVILREGLTVRGMNTAATIWCSGAIGSLAGSGYLIPATIGTTAILFVHIVLRPIAMWLEARGHVATDVETNYSLRVTCHHSEEALVRTIVLRHVGGSAHMSLQGLSAQDEENGQQTVVSADIFATKRNDHLMEELVSRLSIEPQVTAVSWKQEQR